MLILGIETSCDETSASILKIENGNLTLLSNIVASSVDLHAQTGGIIPEEAARQQLLYIIPVIKEAFKKANLSFQEFPVDKIAVTYGPGLIGSLLVGIETARTLSYIFNKELIPVNHLIGHIYANWIGKNVDQIKFPAIALVVSGGHTDLVLLKDHAKFKWLGGTRDDAAGEAFDKIGRLLNLPYPAGPVIEKLAQNGDSSIFTFPKPLIGSKDFDFSFSGLKTAVFRTVKEINRLNDKTVNNICASTQDSISKVLVEKTIKAALKFRAKSLILGGGVSANGKIRNDFAKTLKDGKIQVNMYLPETKLCTDNAAMIAAAAVFFNKAIAWKNIEPNPSLHF